MIFMRVVKYFVKKYVNHKQKQINKLYAEEGASDKVIIQQAKLNSKRHKHDIVDESKLVFENFVQ